MKKSYYLIVLVLILGLTLTGCSLLSNVGQVPDTDQSGITYLTKGTPGDPDEFTLYAGQHIDVGTVEVWNDTDNLYVKYVVNDPWRLTETHLHIFFEDMNYTDVPQKNGNPIPGKFDYKDEHDCVTEYTYTIPLTLVPEDELFIAAHAVVANISIMMEEIVFSRLGIDVYGPIDDYAGLGDPLWASPISAVAAWEHPNWKLYISIPDATWISTAEYVEDPVNNSWRWFHDEITLPEKGYYIAGSVVLATADNAEEVYFNGELVGSNGTWTVLTEYSIEPQPGGNTLDFIVRNYAQAGGNVTSNPTGLIYKVSVTYYPEESAWAGEEPGEIPFPGNNWATYFEYEVEPQYEIVETVCVPSGYVDGVDSTTTLTLGQEYELRASGTYRFANWGEYGIADAEYSYRSAAYTPNSNAGWIQGEGYFTSPCGLDVQVDNACVHWGDLDETNHEYEIIYSGTGGIVHFHIHDSAYGDNEGCIEVEIWKKNY